MKDGEGVAADTLSVEFCLTLLVTFHNQPDEHWTRRSNEGRTLEGKYRKEKGILRQTTCLALRKVGSGGYNIGRRKRVSLIRFRRLRILAAT